MSPFVCIGMMTDSDHSEGNVPELNILLKYSVRTRTPQGAGKWKISSLNSSGPAALVFFEVLTASSTSEILMTPSRVAQVYIYAWNCQLIHNYDPIILGFIIICRKNTAV